jgi:hypothetical protein
MAAECSPGRKPGVENRKAFREPRRGDRRAATYVSPAPRANGVGGRDPRAYARGYRL